jgi:hypothetical protein
MQSAVLQPTVSIDVESPSLADRLWDRLGQRERCGDWLSYVGK